MGVLIGIGQGIKRKIAGYQEHAPELAKAASHAPELTPRAR